MRIGFTQPYSATEVVITGYHDTPEEIKNLEQYAYIVIPNGLVIPAGSMAIHNTTSGTYRFVPIPAVKADEDRITALESENEQLAARLRSAEQAASENSTTAQEILELLIDRGVI